MTSTEAGRIERAVWGTSVALFTTDPARLPAAGAVLIEELAAIDGACSRFRPDSEISRVNAARGATVQVGPLLAEALSVALRAAELTEGIVDPTIGGAVRALGYDRDFARVRDDDRPVASAGPAPGWRRLEWHAEDRTLRAPRGVWLDLGATAKAFAADRIAARAADRAGCGVLVSLGGDVGMGGEPPGEGWHVGVSDDHADRKPAVTVTVTAGGLATSGTFRRRWRRGGRTLHHIVDPRTGDVAAACWRTASVAAATCVDANIASTAAIVLGRAAPGWLDERGLAARLVGEDGTVTSVSGWPA